MTNITSKNRIPHVIYQLLLLVFTSGIAYASLLFFKSSSSTVTDLEVGDVASQDILSPYAITYESDVLTTKKQDEAVFAIAPQYTTANTNIARQQLEKLRLAEDYITSVREDQFATRDQKLADLAALEGIELDQDTAVGLLELTDPRWQTIQEEAVVVLEQVMRNPIKDIQVETARSGVPNLVSLALPEDHAAITAELASAFIVPNSMISEDLTEAARQEAFEGVEPVIVSFAAGETIIRHGEVVTAENIESLQKFGLAETEVRWQDYASIGTIVLLSAIIIIMFFRRKPELVQDKLTLFIIASLFIIYLVGGRLIIPIHYLTPYIYPVAAYALIISSLFGAQTALITVIPLIVLITYGQSNALELVLFYGLSSIFGVLIPRSERRITGFIWVGLSVAGSGAVIVTTYRLLDSEISGLTLLTLFAVIFVNGMITAGFTVLMQSVLAPLLGQTTPLQLLELSRPDHPLLDYLLKSAPGTYQHSLQVANLAEQAAEQIGANSLLTRVGAMYHDIGKAYDPGFFIENQVTGQIDTHENINPEESARKILDHVSMGVALAKQYKLPRRIQDFITEHHGTFKTRYQWTQAVKAAGGEENLVNEENYKYIGPTPQSRETALVMLADGCEARVRASQPSTDPELQKIIENTIETCLTDGQLDNTPLTLRDLDIIKKSFVATIKGIYHPRVEYPTLDTSTRPIPGFAIEMGNKEETKDVQDESDSGESGKTDDSH
jgi:putative nucleotidyltransferase with HDIG domain